MKLYRLTKSVLPVMLATMVLGATFLVPAVANASLPKPFQANYSVSKGSLTLGNLHASLKYSGNKYSYHKYTKATGLAALLTGIKITENTDGQFNGQNITPKNYLYKQSKHTKTKIDKATFTNNTVVGSYKNKAYTIKTKQGTQDRASLELVLARDLSLNKKRLSYTIVGRGEKSQYNFQKLGSEIVKTPAGTFHTVKIKVLRKGNKRQTIFWMAKEIDYLPVKINHIEKGDIITSVIQSYKRL